MGAEQSSSNRLSRAQEERILEAQRKLYEKRCRDIINSHRANQNVQQPATAPRSPSQPNAPPPATIPPRPPAPLTRTNNITLYQPNSNSVDQENRLERNRSPYNYNQADLQNVRESNSRTNLYPNLNNGQTSLAGRPNTSANNNTFRFSNNNNASNTTNYIRPPASDFVFVNHNGSERLGASAPPRERSVSRTREDQDVMCPTCQNIIGLYIYNCSNGHSSCKFCKMRGAQCGKCGQPLTDIRNHALESYVAERKVPCLNKADGCTLVIKLADMESHVKECPFKEMPCPLHDVIGDCPWRGKINQIRIHFDNMHPDQRQGEEDKEMYLPNICSENKFAHLVVKGNFNFLLHLWVSEKDRMVYMTVQLIGTKVSALKWTYEIQIYNKREPRRKYQYLDACHSSNEPLSDIYREVRCAALPLAYAMNFVNEGAVCYKFTINKTFIGRSNFQNKNQRGRGGRRQ